MRQLLPVPANDVDPGEVYGTPLRLPPNGRPWVLGNMIASVDGAIAVDDRSGALGGPADRRVFRLLRALADVVVAGAATVRAERYRPITRPRPVPVAVVSRSLALDWSTPLFTEAVARTVVLTCAAADAGRRARAATVADVVVAGDHEVEPALAMAALAERGHRLVLCEGGPTFLGHLVRSGTLDELCLTIAPLLVGSDGPRVLAGAELEPPAALRVASLLEQDGFLLARYLVER